MKKADQTHFPINKIRICLDSYDDEKCEGRIYGVALKESVDFRGLADLLIRVDEVFDQIGQPQSGQVLRSFCANKNYQSYVGMPERYNESSKIAVMHGKKKTIDLVMVSRHKAEWQGILIKDDGELIGKFDSILECTQLLEGKV